MKSAEGMKAERKARHGAPPARRLWVLLLAAASALALWGCATPGGGTAEESSVEAQSQLVGTWRLLAMTCRDEATGKETDLWGKGAIGLLTYTRDGRMSAVIAAADREITARTAAEASVPEQAALFRTCFAYAGRYTPTRDGAVHHVEVATDPTWIGQDQPRFTHMAGNQLIVRGAPVSTVGDPAPKVMTLTWERVK